jgi:hypothetical protein
MALHDVAARSDTDFDRLPQPTDFNIEASGEVLQLRRRPERNRNEASSSQIEPMVVFEEARTFDQAQPSACHRGRGF